MDKKQIANSKLRVEKSIQYSGFIKSQAIYNLKNDNYYVVDVLLDGDAPKQYIKAYFYYPGRSQKINYKSWDGYYAKFGGKSYPHESIMEYGINKIGEALGLKMNETKIVIANGQIRFLSKDFIKRGSQKLIHGVEILHEYFEDKEFIDRINKDRNKRRELLTFDVIENALLHVHPIQCDELLLDLVKLITFDAIVGNNDRHFYNWGIIGDIKNISNRKVEFSPIYDTARGLLWNTVESQVVKMYNQYVHGSTSQIQAFVTKSKPRFSFDDNPKANHFQLIEYLAQRNVDYKVEIAKLVTENAEKNVLKELKNTIFRYLSDERKFLIVEILKLRFIELRKYV